MTFSELIEEMIEHEKKRRLVEDIERIREAEELVESSLCRLIVLFWRPAADFLNALPEKSQRSITAKLAVLQTDPYPGSEGDPERLNTDGMEVFRLHIGRSFTALYPHTDRNRVEITHLMTVEQAHKRYGRL